jgi:hypothetical protein
MGKYIKIYSYTFQDYIYIPPDPKPFNRIPPVVSVYSPRKKSDPMRFIKKIPQPS